MICNCGQKLQEGSINGCEHNWCLGCLDGLYEIRTSIEGGIDEVELFNGAETVSLNGFDY